MYPVKLEIEDYICDTAKLGKFKFATCIVKIDNKIYSMDILLSDNNVTLSISNIFPRITKEDNQKKLKENSLSLSEQVNQQ